MRIDINCDMGESFGAYKLGLDEEVIKYVTSANIACGYHAGDPLVMEQTVSLAKDHGVAVGAHPGFPDLIGFGRRNLNATLSEIKGYVTYQIGALQAFTKAQGVTVEHVKPHGALYLMAVEDEKISQAIVEAIASVDKNLIFVALAGAKGEKMTQIGKKIGLRVAYEAFPDRAYTPEGTLVSRRQAGAVIKDPDTVAQRALTMAKEGKVVAIDGSEIPFRPETLCVHGDTPGAVNLVRKIRDTLTNEGVEVTSLSTFIG
jgi:UPF0271 protein